MPASTKSESLLRKGALVANPHLCTALERLPLARDGDEVGANVEDQMVSSLGSWATWALRAGKSVRWVAQPLGHQDPAFTLRVYAHAMREEEKDSHSPSSAAPDGPIRPLPKREIPTKRHNPSISLVGRPGVEPGTNGLKARCSTG